MFIEVDWDLHRDRVGLLNGHGVRLLDMDWVRPVDWHMDGVSHWPINRDWDVFVYGVRLWVGHFHWDGVRLFNMHWVRPVYWHVNGNWHGLLNRDSNRHWFFYWVRSRYVDGVRPINGHLDGVTDVLHNWVGLRNGHFNFDGVWHVFLHGVGLGHWNLNGVWNVFLNGVGLRYVHLDGVRPVDGNVDRVRHLLLDGVRSGDVDWDFNVLLHVNRHVFDDLIGLWYGHLDGVRHMSFNGIRHVFLDWYRVRYSFDEGDSSQDIGVFTEWNAVALVRESSVFDGVVGATDTVAAADVTNVKAADTVSIAEVQETTFVQLLV